METNKKNQSHRINSSDQHSAGNPRGQSASQREPTDRETQSANSQEQDAFKKNPSTLPENENDDLNTNDEETDVLIPPVVKNKDSEEE